VIERTTTTPVAGVRWFLLSGTNKNPLVAWSKSRKRSRDCDETSVQRIDMADKMGLRSAGTPQILRTTGFALL
jgi:hypothetical protein